MKNSFLKLVLMAILSVWSVLAFAQSVDENFDRAEQLYAEQNFKKAIVFYKKSSDDGNILATYALANCYYYGQGVDRNVSAAVDLWRQCAESGNAEAQNRMGSCYYEGEAVEKNYDEAARWWKLSADQGNMYRLYAEGVVI